MDKNIVKQELGISINHRNKSNGHRSRLLWFTGLSGSGKSTLADQVEMYLHKKGFSTYILDGDNIRFGLNKDLDFSDEGRKENIRRIAEVSKLFVDAGVIVMTSFISPFREDRLMARELVGDENFTEIYVECPLEICEQRDVKGLYAKARAGLIKNFTGIDSPFEAPENPSIHVNTHVQSIEESLKKITDHLDPKLTL